MHVVGEITIYTHFFKAVPKDLAFRNAIYQFAFQFTEREWKYDPVLRKQVQVNGKVWGGRTDDYSEFRFPISLLGEFRSLLERSRFQEGQVTYTYAKLYQPEPATFKLREKYVPFDYQEEGIAFTLNERAQGVPSCLLQMPTGSGKTVTLLALAARLGLRMGMVVDATHMDKWEADFQEYLGIPADRVYQVRGGKAIRKLFALYESEEFDYDAVLISLPTMMAFFKEYEKSREDCIDLYGGTPIGFWEASGIGFLGGDEVHESFYNVYWLNTFLHGPFHLGLSATMFHREAFKERVQSIVYPRCKRFDKIKPKKCIRQINVGYRFEDIERDRIQTSFPRRTTYAQAAFENSILKNRKVKRNFLEMMASMIDAFYIADRVPGDKLGIYLFRNDMVNDVLEMVKKRYPDLDSRRYIENDPYKDAQEPDIRVTSRGKAGTGIDIKGLTRMIVFDNVDSPQTSVQLIGRLREIVGKDLIYVQLYALNIPKHMTYKKSRDELYADRVISRTENVYQTAL